jgi:hypothetical protein
MLQFSLVEFGGGDVFLGVPNILHRKKIANGVLCDGVHRLSKYQMVSWYIHMSI